MKVTLIVSPEDASLMASALDFVRRSMTLGDDCLKWIFRDGGKFDCSTKDVFSLGYVSESLRQALIQDSDRVRFAGCCKIF